MNRKLETLSEYELAEATRRRAALDQLADMQAEGLSMTEAAERLGVPQSTLYRWRETFGAERDLSALAPKTGNCGRKPMAVLGKLRKKTQALVTRQADNTREPDTSLPLQMISHDLDATDEQIEAIQKTRASKHTHTPTLRRQARVTQEVLQLDRGEKNFKLNSYSQPRDMTYINRDGVRLPLQAGDAFTFDDEHFNQGFFVRCDDPNDPCARRFGVRASRAQHIMGVDYASARCISTGIIARHNDAFDERQLQWQFLRTLRCGIPRQRVFILEKNVFAATGIALALARVGITVKHAATAKGKSIMEERIYYRQKATAHCGLNLGRTRGEFEEANKLWLDIRAGKLDPEKEGYLPAEEFIKRNAAAITFMNSEKMEGDIYNGVPDEIWVRQMHGRELAKPTMAEVWDLQPEQHQVAIRNGHVRCRVADCNGAFYFHAPWFVGLGRNYKVTVCFDPAYPEGGAAILNREEGGRVSDRGVTEHFGRPGDDYVRPYRLGEFIGVADYVERVPQFSLSEEYDDSASFNRRKEYIKHVRMMYREILPFNRGIAATADERRDGRGATQRMEVSTNEPQPVEVNRSEPRRVRAKTSNDIFYGDMSKAERAEADRQMFEEPRREEPKI